MSSICIHLMRNGLRLKFAGDQQRHWFCRNDRSRIAGKRIVFPIPKDRLKCRHFLSVNGHRWPTDTARCRPANRRPNWASSAASSDRPRSPHDFSIITLGRFVRLSNLRIDRILTDLSPPRLALFNESRLGGSTNISVWRLNYILPGVHDAA